MKKILIILIGSASVFFFLNSFTLPVFILEQQGEIIFLRPIKPGDTFLLAYLHSVARTDVWEKFTIDDKYQITLTETMFQGQGAGLPYNLSANEKLTREGSWFKITGMKRIVPMLHWRVDAQWRSRLRFNQEEIIPAANIAHDGIIHIKVAQMKLIDFLINKSQKLLGKGI